MLASGLKMSFRLGQLVERRVSGGATSEFKFRILPSSIRMYGRLAVGAGKSWKAVEGGGR
jgi:hypothetical protein